MQSCLAAPPNLAPLFRCTTTTTPLLYHSSFPTSLLTTAAATATFSKPAAFSHLSYLPPRAALVDVHALMDTHISPSPESYLPVGKKHALISLSDKRDLAFLGNELQHSGGRYSIVSTGGTATALEAAGVYVTKVEEITCFPEMLDGRVKTLHPCIHAGVLARRDSNHHMEALNKHGMGTIDIVVVNLYPFYENFSCSKEITFEDDIENINIGGPAMIRAAAKIVVAPKYTPKGLEVLRGKSKALRILEAKSNVRGKMSLRQVGGGWLAQDTDDVVPDDISFNVKSLRCPEDGELSDAKFAWLCAKHVKSNAIVLAKNNCMLGMGSGQPNWLESLRIALRKAGAEAKGATLASDAFFPFAWNDAVEEACQSGVAVIAEPGGSIRDKDAIDCCDKYGVSLLFTNARHFRH